MLSGETEFSAADDAFYSVILTNANHVL